MICGYVGCICLHMCVCMCVHKCVDGYVWMYVYECVFLVCEYVVYPCVHVVCVCVNFIFPNLPIFLFYKIFEGFGTGDSYGIFSCKSIHLGGWGGWMVDYSCQLSRWEQV